MISQKTSQKKYGLFILAIVLLLSGGAALFVGLHDFAIRSAGLVAIIASAYLVRISHIRNRSIPSAASREVPDFKAGNRPRRLVWAFGVGLLFALAACYVWIYSDASHGGRSGLPVYLFGGLIVTAGIVWGYLVSRSG